MTSTGAAASRTLTFESVTTELIDDTRSGLPSPKPGTSLCSWSITFVHETGAASAAPSSAPSPPSPASPRSPTSTVSVCPPMAKLATSGAGDDDDHASTIDRNVPGRSFVYVKLSPMKRSRSPEGGTEASNPASRPPSRGAQVAPSITDGASLPASPEVVASRRPASAAPPSRFERPPAPSTRELSPPPSRRSAASPAALVAPPALHAASATAARERKRPLTAT